MQETLFQRVRSQQTPTTIVTGKFMPTCDQEIDALLNPPDLTNESQTSERGAKLRAHARTALRAVDSVKGFLHGQSISLMGREARGLCAVLLTPRNEECGPGPVYALAVCHLSNGVGDGIGERNVITSGGLDILAKLACFLQRLLLPV